VSVGLLLITHEGIGSAVLEAATRMLGRCPLRAEVLPVALEADTEALRALADQRADSLDDGDGVLVLTDLYGSTPSNIAASLASRGAVRIVSGLNLPMLVRILNYPAEDLAGLADKAVTGGNRGILLCGARSPDAA
jgi:PTS system ascorbate-specific IIA component